jgi:putative ABC transport system substrate-binding protein
VSKANRGCRQRLSLATVGSLSEIALAGGLLAYAVDLKEMARLGAWYVDEILRCTPPGDLPFEEASKYQLFINVGTAMVLGLTVPPNLIAISDKVIEQRRSLPKC